MDATQTLEAYAQRQGWNDDTKLQLALEYIQNQGDTEAFDDFLTQRAAAEEAEVSEESVCQNCGKRWFDFELKPTRDYAQRVEPGEPAPSGECPECGALCQPAPAEEGNV